MNTHGIKGEVRILSDFLFKDAVFKKHRKFYIGKHKIVEVMNTYRKHKQYDMVTFEGISDINEVLKYKGESIYVNRDDLDIDGFVNEDFIGLEVKSNRDLGKVIEVLQVKQGRILKVRGENGQCSLIPLVDEFVKNIDIKKGQIEIEEIEGLIDEDLYFNVISRNV